MPPVRIALIGTGGISGSHVRGIKGQGDKVQFVAAADVVPASLKKFQETHGVPKTYLDAEEMLAKEKPQIVHICTPPHIHCKLSVAALKAGAWVLCEKPLCASLAELDEIQAAEKETGNKCASVFQWRYGSGGKHLQKLIREQAMGKLLLGVCHTLWYRGSDYYAKEWRGKWKSELGGCSMGHGIHAMDFFLWQMGRWEEVDARIGTLDHNISVEDVSMAMVRFASGALGSIVNSVCSPRQETVIRFDFQKGTAEVKELYGYENKDWTFSGIERKDGEDPAVADWRNIGADVRSTHGAQLAELLEDMAAKRTPRTSGEDARSTIEFLSSLYKSAATKQPVARGSIKPGDPFYAKVYGDLETRGQ